MLLLAHLSDIHLDDDPASAARTRQVLEHVLRLPMPVDAILVTGDIADNGADEEYRQAAGLFDVGVPVLHCPGNHDSRAEYRRSLLGDSTQPAGAPIDAPVNARHDIAGAVFLMCDSSIPMRNEGRLGDDTLAWVAAQLADAGDAPVFIAFHHPPVGLRHPVLDTMLLTDPGPLADLIGAHPNVVAVLTGHAHMAATSMFAGRPLLVAPGVRSMARLPWEGDGPLVDRDQPPALVFHVYDDGRLSSIYKTLT